MKLFKCTYFLLFAASLVISSCVKEKSFPTQPVIEFISYDKHGTDSADCIISFRDGDGDIGIMDGDTISPDDLVMKYLYKGSDGVFRPYYSPALNDTLYYGYRISDITPEGQYKALEGEIKAKLRSAPLYFPTHTAVKFEIKLRDRAGNWSNMVTTNEINP
jgi:hypothetical protein